MHDAPLFASLTHPSPPDPGSKPARSPKPVVERTDMRAAEPSARAPARRSSTAPTAARVAETERDTMLVSERVAARLLSISERKLWEMRMQGLIPHVRFGRAVRYDPVDLKKWINDQKRAAAG